MALAFALNTPFEKQLEFLRNKLNLPSERWDDIKKQAHDKAFIVAGAQQADLIQDLHHTIEQAIASGRGINEFRDNFTRIVAKYGWSGWTGQGTAAGEAWRTKIIYQTNASTSYAAGRYAQMTDADWLKSMPMWQYVHNDSVIHPRPLHLSWHGTTLPHDHPFWQTHSAPNGWGCQCRIVPKRKGTPSKQPPDNWQQVDAKTGAPIGIDKGFDYQPGASVKRTFQSLIDDKLIKLNAPIGAVIWQVLKPVIEMERQLIWWETLDKLAVATRLDGGYSVVGVMSQDVVDWLNDYTDQAPLSAEIAIEHYLPFGKKQVRHTLDKNGLTLEEWRNLPMLLDKPGAIYFDTENNTLVFVAEEIGPTKVAVEFKPKKQSKKTVNLILTAFRVDEISIANHTKSAAWKMVNVFGRR